MLRFAYDCILLNYSIFLASLNYLLVTGENKNLAKWLKALYSVLFFGFASLSMH